MKAPAEFVARLRRAPGTIPAHNEADVIREVQKDAYQAGYTRAAEELLGIAMASQERSDGVLKRAQRR